MAISIPGPSHVEDLAQKFSRQVDVWEGTGDKHGRKEAVEVRVCYDLDWLDQRDNWAGLQSLVEVVTTREEKGKSSIETRYYLSSRKGSAEEFGRWIRLHWSIENKVHWVADVVFKEDASKASLGHIQENMAIVRRLAMNIVVTTSLQSDEGKAVHLRSITVASEDQKKIYSALGLSSSPISATKMIAQ